MEKTNIRKKIVAILLAISGISGINDGNLLAVKTMKQYERSGQPLSETVPHAKELDFYGLTPNSLKTPKQLQEFLVKNKFDIFYVYEKGKVAQEKVYNIAKKTKNEIYNRIDLTKTAERNWHNIGRHVLNSAGYKKNKKNFLKEELQYIERGDINCTGWATTLHWFLNQNKIPARILYTENHWQVCVPLTNNEHDEIRLYTINVIEGWPQPSVDYVDFTIDPLAASYNDDEWVTLGVGADYHTELQSKKGAYKNTSPIQLYLDHIDREIGKTRNAWLKGLQTEFQNLEEDKKIKTNSKSRTYALRYLPHQWDPHRKEHTIKIPLNVEKLGKPISDNHRDRKELTYSSLSNPGKKIRWIEGEVKFTDSEWKNYKNGAIRVYPSGYYNNYDEYPYYEGYDKLFATIYSSNDDTFREIPINVEPEDNVEGFWTGDKLITIPTPRSEIKLSSDFDDDESEKKVRRRKKPRY